MIYGAKPRTARGQGRKPKGEEQEGEAQWSCFSSLFVVVVVVVAVVLALLSVVLLVRTHYPSRAYYPVRACYTVRTNCPVPQG